MGAGWGDPRIDDLHTELITLPPPDGGGGGGRVDDIHTETASAPFGGTQLFVMTGKATSDQPVDAAALRAGFRELENELNVDLSLSSSSRR